MVPPQVHVLTCTMVCCAFQHKRTCRRLLKHLPMIDNGEVEVDSLLVHNTKIIYKCSAVSGSGGGGEQGARSCWEKGGCWSEAKGGGAVHH